MLASAGFDDLIELWRIPELTRIRSLKMHRGKVHTIIFHPDGNRLISANDESVRIWDVATGNCLGVLKGKPGVTSVACSPNGKLVASGYGDELIRVWDAASGDCLATVGDRGFGSKYVTFSPDGKYLAATSPSRYAVELWEVKW